MPTIATWNVNSINARLPNVLDWLRRAKPDIVLLQEIKCQDAAFPTEAVGDLGYNVATLGQKSYNGVAILSLQPLEDVTPGLPGDLADEQARYLEASVGASGWPPSTCPTAIRSVPTSSLQAGVDGAPAGACGVSPGTGRGPGAGR